MACAPWWCLWQSRVHVRAYVSTYYAYVRGLLIVWFIWIHMLVVPVRHMAVSNLLWSCIMMCRVCDGKMLSLVSHARSWGRPAPFVLFPTVRRWLANSNKHILFSQSKPERSELRRRDWEVVSQSTWVIFYLQHSRMGCFQLGFQEEVD